MSDLYTVEDLTNLTVDRLAEELVKMMRENAAAFKEFDGETAIKKMANVIEKGLLK